MKGETWVRLLLTVLLLVIGAPTLPITAGMSATAIVAGLMAIWGIDT